MADSKRTDIVQALLARLALILTTGGYETNLGSNIFEWRDPNLAFSELPAMNVKDIEETVEEGITTVDSNLHTLNFVGEIFTNETSTIPDNARKALADLDKAIGVDETFGSLSERTTAVSSIIESNQDKKVIIKTIVSFSVEYRTNRWDAYT